MGESYLLKRLKHGLQCVGLLYCLHWSLLFRNGLPSRTRCPVGSAPLARWHLLLQLCLLGHFAWAPMLMAPLQGLLHVVPAPYCGPSRAAHPLAAVLRVCSRYAVLEGKAAASSCWSAAVGCTCTDWDGSADLWLADCSVLCWTCGALICRVPAERTPPIRSRPAASAGNKHANPV